MSRRRVTVEKEREYGPGYWETLSVTYLCSNDDCNNEARYVSGLCGVCDLLSGKPTDRVAK